MTTQQQSHDEFRAPSAAIGLALCGMTLGLVGVYAFVLMYL